MSLIPAHALRAMGDSTPDISRAISRLSGDPLKDFRQAFSRWKQIRFAQKLHAHDREATELTTEEVLQFSSKGHTTGTVTLETRVVPKKVGALRKLKGRFSNPERFVKANGKPTVDNRPKTVQRRYETNLLKRQEKLNHDLPPQTIAA